MLGSERRSYKVLAHPFHRLCERHEQLGTHQIESSTSSLSRLVDSRVLESLPSQSDFARFSSFESPDLSEHPMSFHVGSAPRDFRSVRSSKGLLGDRYDPGLYSPHAVKSRGSTGFGVDLETGASHLVRLTPVGHTYVQYAVRGRPFVSKVSEVVTSRAEVAKLRAAADQGAAWARDNAALREQVQGLEKELADARRGTHSSSHDAAEPHNHTNLHRKSHREAEVRKQRHWGRKKKS
jgi:hypothetical protein